MEKCDGSKRETWAKQEHRMSHGTEDGAVLLVCVFVCEREQFPKFALLFSAAETG